MTKNWKYILLMAVAFPTAATVAQSVDAGRRAVELEKYQQAKSVYKAQLNNKDADNAYFALGDVYLRTEKLDSAAYYFNQGLAKNSKSAINMVGLGKLELARGNKAAAEEHFEQALKRSKSKDAYVLSMIAEAYAHSDEKDMTKAIEYAELAVEREKFKSPLAFVVLGDVYKKQQEYGKAMTNYEQAIAIDNNYATAHYKLGQLNTSSRIYNTAEEEYKKVIEIDPNYAPAYHDLGELYFLVGKYDEAVSTFKKYLELAEQTPATRAKYAAFLYKTKDYKSSLEEVQKALAQDPNNTVMNRLQAYNYYELNQPAEALKAMENYMAKVDKNKIISNDYEYYGRILNKNKQPVKAIENLEKALEFENAKIELYSELANLYASEKKFDKAVEMYEKKREKEATPLDFYYIGNIYLAAGNHKKETGDVSIAAKDFMKADSTFNKMLEIDSTYAHAHLWRAYANANLDPESEKGLAKPHFEKFITLAEPNKEKYKNDFIQAYSYLAYYYLVQNDNPNSIKYWKEVLTLDPENENAQLALKQLEKAPARKR